MSVQIETSELQEKCEELKAIRAAKAEVEAELKQAKEMEAECEAHVMHLMDLQNLMSFSNELFTIHRRSVNTPQIENYDELIEYIKQEDAWDLLQKRLSSVAARERWDQDIDIPGVSCWVKEDITIKEKK